MTGTKLWESGMRRLQSSVSLKSGLMFIVALGEKTAASNLLQTRVMKTPAASRKEIGSFQRDAILNWTDLPRTLSSSSCSCLSSSVHATFAGGCYISFPLLLFPPSFASLPLSHTDIVQITPLLPGARPLKLTMSVTAWRGRRTRTPCCCGRTSPTTTCRAPSPQLLAQTQTPVTAKARARTPWVLFAFRVLDVCRSLVRVLSLLKTVCAL